MDLGILYTKASIVIRIYYLAWSAGGRKGRRRRIEWRVCE